MKKASVPRPFAELLVREMHDTSVPHYDGWQKLIAPGWHIRRVGTVYRLEHGRTSVGEVVGIEAERHILAVTLGSGLLVGFPIREPKVHVSNGVVA